MLFPDLDILQVEFSSFINAFSNDMGDSTTGIFNDFQVRYVLSNGVYGDIGTQ